MMRMILVALLAVGWTGPVLGQEKTAPFRVRSISFTGNQAVPDRVLRSIMLTRKHKWYARASFDPRIFQDDVSSLELYYQQNGYLEARVIRSAAEMDTARRAVRITIEIEEGDQTLIEGIALFGNRVFSDSVLLAAGRLKPGTPFKRPSVRKAVLNLLKLYADHGYLEANVQPDIKVNSQTHRALVDLVVTENELFSIGRVSLGGLGKVRPPVVRRELSFRTGDIVSFGKLLESQRRLYLTGLFQTVYIRPHAPADSARGIKDILVEIKEKKSVSLDVSLGFGTLEKVRTQLSVSNHNIKGTARQAGITGKASFIGQSLELSFTEPWTFGTRWRTDLNALASFLKEPGYDQAQAGIRSTVGRSFGKRSQASFSYRYEMTRLTDIQVAILPQEQQTRLQGLMAAVNYDTRDNLFNTTRGLFAEARTELAVPVLRFDDAFIKVEIGYRHYLPLGKNTVVASALQAGWMEQVATGSGIPLQERFYAGGPNSLRGFGYQLAGPLDPDGTPEGGMFKLVCNLVEVRQTLYKMVGLAAFADLGNVWSRASDFRFSGIRSTVGAGLRANTPLGIARCDYGVNVFPQANEPGWQVHVSVGQAF